MKKLTIIFYLFLIPLCVFAQNESSISHTKTVNDSTFIIRKSKCSRVSK